MQQHPLCRGGKRTRALLLKGTYRPPAADPPGDVPQRRAVSLAAEHREGGRCNQPPAAVRQPAGVQQHERA